MLGVCNHISIRPQPPIEASHSPHLFSRYSCNRHYSSDVAFSDIFPSVSWGRSRGPTPSSGASTPRASSRGHVVLSRAQGGRDIHLSRSVPSSRERLQQDLPVFHPRLNGMAWRRRWCMELIASESSVLSGALRDDQLCTQYRRVRRSKRTRDRDPSPGRPWGVE